MHYVAAYLKAVVEVMKLIKLAKQKKHIMLNVTVKVVLKVMNLLKLSQQKNHIPLSCSFWTLVTSSHNQ